MGTDTLNLNDVSFDYESFNYRIDEEHIKSYTFKLNFFFNSSNFFLHIIVQKN